MRMKVDNIGITFRIPIALLESLRSLARTQSVMEGKDIRYTDLLRDAVLQVYPLSAPIATGSTVMAQNATNEGEGK